MIINHEMDRNGVSVALDYEKMNKNYGKKLLFLTKF